MFKVRGVKINPIKVRLDKLESNELIDKKEKSQIFIRLIRDDLRRLR